MTQIRWFEDAKQASLFVFGFNEMRLNGVNPPLILTSSCCNGSFTCMLQLLRPWPRACRTTLWCSNMFFLIQSRHIRLVPVLKELGECYAQLQTSPIGKSGHRKTRLLKGNGLFLNIPLLTLPPSPLRTTIQWVWLCSASQLLDLMSGFFFTLAKIKSLPVKRLGGRVTDPHSVVQLRFIWN